MAADHATRVAALEAQIEALTLERTGPACAWRSTGLNTMSVNTFKRLPQLNELPPATRAEDLESRLGYIGFVSPKELPMELNNRTEVNHLRD
jgi:hypothetical protein